ncbi:MAG: hypothetical protein E6R03_13430 [Hyphomicrobiaceae bacterium]|nr:MAG: hypothetical protein E6R03_13430 [Hyphomicrobiaceae bacterium]
MRKIKIDGIAYIPCGPGGPQCACCFPPPGPRRKAIIKAARRRAKARMMREQMELLSDPD